MTKVKVYQIIQYTPDGIELQFETTDKEKAYDEFDSFEGEDETHLVQVLKTNQDTYYLKDSVKGDKHLKI